MTVEMFRAEDYASEDAGEDRAHEALFAHVGVTNPNDWRGVALALACRYSPGLLMDPEPCSHAIPAKKGGRPTEWNEMAYAGLLYIIEEIQQHARAKTINKNLSTSASACAFFAEDKEAEFYRNRAWMVPKGVSAATYQNRLSMARGMRPD